MHSQDLTPDLVRCIEIASRCARRWARSLCSSYVDDAGQAAAVGVLTTVRRGGTMNEPIAFKIGFRAARVTSRMQLPAHTALGAAVPKDLLAAKTVELSSIEGTHESSRFSDQKTERYCWENEVRTRLDAVTPSERVELLTRVLDGEPITMTGTTRSQLCRLRQLLRDDHVLRQLWEDQHDR